MKLLHGVSLLLVASAANVSAQENHEHHHAAPVTQSSAESPSPHIPPAPPANAMEPMSAKEMVDVMGMDDAARYGKFMLNEAEWGDSRSFAWDLDTWYGSDTDKLWIKSEGEQGDDDAFSVDLLWDHVFARWWSVQSGIRSDEREGEQQTSAVLALQGLAPQWFEVEASLYAGEHGDLSLHAEADYDLLLTQRLILQPDVKLTVNADSDASRGIGSGLSDLEVGLRLRYELRPEIAPYVGLRWVRNFGSTADFARAAGRDDHDLQAVAGLRFWF